MGRKKVELKRIEDKSSRQVTFSKRRNGLIKKARELSVLCDVDLALIIFSSRGRLYEFSSGNELANVLERYQKWYDDDANSNHGKEKSFGGECANLLSHSEMLQIVESCLGESHLEQLSVTNLVQLEKQLDAALSQTRSRKTQLMMESIVNLHDQEKTLLEERERLQREIAAIQGKTNDDDNKLVIGNSNHGDNNLSLHSQQATLHLLQ